MKRIIKVVAAAIATVSFQFVLAHGAHAYQKSQVTGSPKTLPSDSTIKTRASLQDYFRKAAGLGFSGAVLAAKDGKILIRNGYG